VLFSREKARKNSETSNKREKVTMKSILAGILFLQGTIAFHMSPHTRLSFIVRHLSDCDFDGFIGFGDAPSEEGRKLALEFERELRMRNELVKKEKEASSQSNRRLLSEEELRIINQRAFSKRRQVIAGKDVVSSSAGFFKGQGQSVYSFPLDNPPRPETPSDDYSLTNNNSSLALPVIFVLALISIYMAVGLTGGITEDGVDLQDWNAIGDAVNDGSALERVVPSVYL
jgi:hypothetical protein